MHQYLSPLKQGRAETPSHGCGEQQASRDHQTLSRNKRFPLLPSTVTGSPTRRHLGRPLNRASQLNRGRPAIRAPKDRRRRPPVLAKRFPEAMVRSQHKRKRKPKRQRKCKHSTATLRTTVAAAAVMLACSASRSSTESTPGLRRGHRRWALGETINRRRESCWCSSAAMPCPRVAIDRTHAPELAQLRLGRPVKRTKIQLYLDHFFFISSFLSCSSCFKTELYFVSLLFFGVL